MERDSEQGRANDPRAGASAPHLAPKAGMHHWWGRPASTRSFLVVMTVGALASVLALIAGVRPLFQSARARRGAIAEATRLDAASRALESRQRIAGVPSGAAVLVRVANAGDGTRQRTVREQTAEPLAPGERIRIAVQPGSHRFLVAISIGTAGRVTPLYPQSGGSLPVPSGGAMQYLPDGLELTGGGTERLVVVLTDEPLAQDLVHRAAVAAFRLGAEKPGDAVLQMPRLSLPGEQFHRVFAKR